MTMITLREEVPVCIKTLLNMGELDQVLFSKDGRQIVEIFHDG